MHRLMIEVGAVIGASAGMLVATVVGGHLLMAGATSAAADVEQSVSASCFEQRLVPVQDGGLHAVVRLCLTRDDVQPTIELTGMPSGTVYSAWLAYLEHPLTSQIGRCASAQLAAQGETSPPGRIASSIAEQDGRVALSSTLPGLHVGGNSEVEILVVDHGLPSAAWTSTRARQLLAWDRTWWGLPVASVPLEQASSHLLGCTAFWLRGGAELTDH